MSKIIYLLFLTIVSVATGQVLEAQSDSFAQYEEVEGNEWILINHSDDFSTHFQFDFGQKKAIQSSSVWNRDYEIIEFQKLKDGNYVVGLREADEEDLAVIIDFKLNKIITLTRSDDFKIKSEYWISEFKNK